MLMTNKVTLQERLERALEDSITEVIQPFCDPLKYFILPPGISSRSFSFHLISYLYQTVGNLGNDISLLSYKKKKKKKCA